MFIELTEILRCPRDHAESYLVASPMVMDGRHIVRGAVGCPECRAEFPIVDGVAYFGAAGVAAAGETGAAAPEPYDADALAAFLNLSGPGGYVVLVGAAARHGPALVEAVPGVHLVAVNPPADLRPGPMLSLLVSPRVLPVRTASVRGVALGAGHARGGWPAEGARVLLPGLRLVIEDGRASPPSSDVEELARGAGLFVGRRSR